MTKKTLEHLTSKPVLIKMSKKTKKNSKPTSRELQSAALRFLESNPKKRFAARQILHSLHLDNSKDAMVYALTQLVQSGKAIEHLDKKFSAAADRPTFFDEPQFVENLQPSARATFSESKKTAAASTASPLDLPQKIEESLPTDFFEDGETAPPRPGGRGYSHAARPSNPDLQVGEAQSIFQKEKKGEKLPIASQSAFDKFEKIEEKKAARLERQSKKTANSTTAKIIEGRMDATRTGAGYVVSDALDEDVFINPRNMSGAMHGDTVRVSLFKKVARARRGRTAFVPKQEGEVVEIVKRATENFLGTLRVGRRHAILLPDNPNVPSDIHIPLENLNGAGDGEKVVVQITDWRSDSRQMPVGRVKSSLGVVGGNDFEMKKILINAGFDLEHSDEAQAEAAAIPEKISEQEIQLRRDFRDVLTFTIDPEDAKDFDDALSIKELEDGNLEIGIHIADVTHFLKPGTPLDKEAFQRSTSVYLVDRVCPMLPEKLSNNLCSLVPHEDRLTFSAVFVFDKKDKIVSRWFGKTIIHSAHRFAYETAQLVLENRAPEDLQGLEIFEKLDWALKNLLRISKKMRSEREKNGAIGFESDEIRFRLAPDGTPLEAFVKDRKEAHLLIEDFMLLANKEVAIFMDEKSKTTAEVPFVYRVHDLPDMEKVAEFSRFAFEMGVKLLVDTPKQLAKSYNDLMRAAQKDERLKLLEPLAIRTMAKAVYSAQNIGHFGLGFSHYSHFTSPIRRYSDVLAHRILEKNLHGNTFRVEKSKLEEQCKHISAQEKRAADAERESIKFKQAELTQRQIGQTMVGIISGFVERGFFVELPNSKAEGMVAFRDLIDNYVLQNGNLQARGSRRGRIFKMGDRVRVRVFSVDLQKRQIELELMEDEF